MNYIDKIKKNGVIYAIRGTGSSSGGGSASEAETAQGVALTYEPDEETGIQVLDKHYGLGAVDTITWTRPAPTADDFIEQQEEEGGGEILKGPIPVIAEEDETISCPLVYTDAERDVAVYLGSPFVQVDSYKAGVKLLLLVGGSLLFDIGVRFEIVWNSVDVFGLDAESKFFATFDVLNAVGADFNDYYGQGNPIDVFNANQGGGGRGVLVKGAENADGEDGSFEPNVKDLAHMLRSVAAMSKLAELGDPTRIINDIVGAMNLTNASYLSSLTGIAPQSEQEEAPVE